jgi:hypothetical protein
MRAFRIEHVVGHLPSEPNALYFDNGIESYVLKQFLNLIRPDTASPNGKL